MASNVRITWNGSRAIAAIRTATEKGVSDALEYLLEKSNSIAPLDEDTLIRSGETDINVGSKGVEGSVFYDTPYAAKLHEHPEYNFQNGRQGKYLEKTVSSETMTVRDYIRRSLRGAL